MIEELPRETERSYRSRVEILTFSFLIHRFTLLDHFNKLAGLSRP